MVGVRGAGYGVVVGIVGCCMSVVVGCGAMVEVAS